MLRPRARAEGRFSNRLVDRLGIAAIALVIARPLGPPLGFGGSPASCYSLSPDAVALHVYGVPCVAAGGWRESSPQLVLVLAWDVWQGLFDGADYLGTPPSGTPSTWTILQHSIGKIDASVRQMIAVFGWIDIAAPSLTFVVWFLVLGGMIAPQSWFRRVHGLSVLTSAIGLTLVLPVLLEARAGA